ncbi:putative glycerol-3-phosphate transporter 4 [Prunus yedoensis var. nudiflora]|uniref:Putative glycerol-3-phosphate transporter 4 n=1 Tax=Prunus yedoensis var. nudiflora TaxID=2094558 RepID=A0A314UVJ9_PRUYE|nr:putative glycerol-3-phosphate transporter 4 [Prunus yedoensis var. nudiflora]
MSNSSDTRREIPPGILLIRSIRGKDWSLSTYRYVILLVTFIAYACYHASRKPSSIVKSVLYPDPNKGTGLGLDPLFGRVFVKEEFGGNGNYRLIEKGWAPFNGTDGTSKLGEIDLAFLACYSLGMYAAGHLGDTLDLRLFLTVGMIGSGIFVALFGMGYFWNVHVFGFYLGMQMVAGLFQATGWPSVVAVIVPGAFIAVGGVMVFFFLAPYPEDIGFSFPQGSPSDLEANPKDEEANVRKETTEEDETRTINRAGSVSRTSVGLLEACLIPGVIPFALCLFFSKLVAYTFLYWLPFYLSQTEIGGEYVSVKSAGNLSTLFDVVGGY